MRTQLMRPPSFKRFFAAVCALAPCAYPLQTLADTAAVWDGGTANWGDPSHWSTAPLFPNNSAGTFFDAAIGAGIVTLNQSIAINQLALSGGTLAGGSAIQLAEGLAWSSGAIALTGVGSVVLGSGSASSASGAPVFTSGRIIGGGGASLGIPFGATLSALNDASFFADIASPLWTMNNAGTFISRSTTGSGFTSMDAIFNNTGTVRVERAGGAGQTLSLAGGGTHTGTFDLTSGTALELGNNTTLQNGASFAGDGMLVVAGQVALAGNVSGENLTVAVGDLNVGSSVLNVTGTAAQVGGTARMSGGTFRIRGGTGTLVMDDGTLSGFGTLQGNLETQGVIAPDANLTVTGTTTLGADSRLLLEIGGTSAGSFDRLISASAFLGGTLEVRLANGFMPAAEDNFTILTAASGVSDFFGNLPLDGMRFSTADGQGSFAIDYTPTSVHLTQFVPEPSGLVFAALGGAILAARRRRQR